jgi:hypothetical protein
MFAAPQPCANAAYYQNGLGIWRGSFRFKVTNWDTLRSSRIGLTNRFLVLSMVVTMGLFGKAYIWSRLTRRSNSGDTVGNEVRISRMGLTLYFLEEQYDLDRDCRQVWVRSKERFGPVPFLFNVKKEHPAEVLSDGFQAIYYIPLLGTDWVGDYRVSDDKNHIRSVLTCPWGEAEEVIDRVAS